MSKIQENIQFATSYNIHLNYPKASLAFRILAFAIDLAIQVVLLLLFRLILGNNILTDAISIFILCFWNLFFEIILNGRSIGKAALGLRIISLNGDNTGIKALVIRWSLKIVDILLTLGMGAILSILSTRLNQRSGDIIAGTTVIETNITKDLNLNFLEKMDNKQYTVTYPEVSKYKEEDILLVKEVYLRSGRHNNEENNKILKSICQKIALDLEIPFNKIKDQRKFLKTVIEDYIMLTR